MIALLISEALRKRGWSKAELARRMGKDPDSGYRLIRKWETGETAPDRESLALLAGALEMTIDELVRILEEREPDTVGWRDFLERLERRGDALTPQERSDLVLFAIRKPGWRAEHFDAVLGLLRLAV